MANLLDLVSESLSEQDRLCESVRRELESSEEPAKLVVDTVRDFFWEESELSNVRKRSCVLLLEQMLSLRPVISPAVKAEAETLARRWTVEIRGNGKDGVLDVIGFLLFLSAYDLVDQFDGGGGEIALVLWLLGNRRRPIGAGESGVVIGSHAIDPASSNAASLQQRPDRTLKEELELVNQIASSFTNHYEALTSLCKDMNGNNLKLFLYEYLGSHDWSTELHGALKEAPDPAKLVLDTMAGFLSPQLESHKSLSKDRVRTSSILLLEQLMALPPSHRKVNPSLKEEAFKLASHRGSNFAQMYQSPVIAHGFLLFVASYKIKSMFKVHELYGLLVVASRYKAHPLLCKTLGFTRKAEDFVQILIRKKVLLGAIDYVYAYDLVLKFPPVNLLKDHLKLLRQRADEQREKQNSQQAADEEIAGIKTVYEYIVKYKLQSEYQPEELEKQILELENKKNLEARQFTNVPISPVCGASTKLDAQVKVTQAKVVSSPKEVRELDNRARVNIELYDPTLDNQARVKVQPSPEEDPNHQAQVNIEPSPKEDPTLDNQARVKVQPSSKEDPKLSSGMRPRSRTRSLTLPDLLSESSDSVQLPNPNSDQAQVNIEPSTLDNQARVKVQPYPKEDPKLDNQTRMNDECPIQKSCSKFENRTSKVESSTSLWPHLASVFEKGVNFLSRKDEKEVDFPASQSTSLCPELKSFCANADGKSLIMFLCDHMDDHDLQNSVHDAFKHAVDPAKLVLDAMPGNLHSNLEFDKNLQSSDKGRNIRILLLEELSNTSPQISPSVKDEAQKMANEWCKMDAAPSNVYGFLLFIASYGLVSNYEVDELLKLLLSANYHKATPSLCRILGLRNQVSGLIRNLIQKNLILEAIEHIYEFESLDEFRPVDLLKYHLYATGRNKLSSEDDMKREIAATRRFTVCIKKYKLESQFPLKDLEKYKSELEIRLRV